MLNIFKWSPGTIELNSLPQLSVQKHIFTIPGSTFTFLSDVE